jgi:pyruvate dehydrogenase E2 component (dihydrolipoamide acetyltransferase)
MSDIFEIKIPHSGSVENVEINDWFVVVGDDVTENQALADVSTDKVDTELDSPRAGRIVKILHGEGAEVPVGTVVALMVDQGTSEADAENALATYVPSAPADQ